MRRDPEVAEPPGGEGGLELAAGQGANVGQHPAPAEGDIELPEHLVVDPYGPGDLYPRAPIGSKVS